MTTRRSKTKGSGCLSDRKCVRELPLSGRKRGSTERGGVQESYCELLTCCNRHFRIVCSIIYAFVGLTSEPFLHSEPKSENLLIMKICKILNLPPKRSPYGGKTIYVCVCNISYNYQKRVCVYVGVSVCLFRSLPICLLLIKNANCVEKCLKVADLNRAGNAEHANLHIHTNILQCIHYTVVVVLVCVFIRMLLYCSAQLWPDFY